MWRYERSLRPEAWLIIMKAELPQAWQNRSLETHNASSTSLFSSCLAIASARSVIARHVEEAVDGKLVFWKMPANTGCDKYKVPNVEWVLADSPAEGLRTGEMMGSARRHDRYLLMSSITSLIHYCIERLELSPDDSIFSFSPTLQKPSSIQPCFISIVNKAI